MLNPTLSESLKRLRRLSLLGVVGLAVAFGATACEEKTAGEKVGDAIDELGDGIDDAADELSNKGPAEKLGEDIDEAGDELRESLN